MIITTIDQVREVLPTVASEVRYEDFQPHLESAENWLSNDILGPVLFGKVEDETITDAKLLRLVKKVVVQKAYKIGIPFMDLVQTATGFGVVNDKNRAPASRARVDALIAQVQLQLDNETEWLLNYLEDTATYHTDWKSSSAYSILSDCLIRTARELKRLVKFEGSREEFLQLKPLMINTTTIVLGPQISATYVDELISKQNGGTLNTYDNKVLPGIKQALANYVIEKDWFGRRLLDDAVTIMENDIENYATYADSDEKELKDDPGFENEETNPMFIFKGGI